MLFRTGSESVHSSTNSLEEISESYAIIIFTTLTTLIERRPRFFLHPARALFLRIISNLNPNYVSDGWNRLKKAS